MSDTIWDTFHSFGCLSEKLENANIVHEVTEYMLTEENDWTVVKICKTQQTLQGVRALPSNSALSAKQDTAKVLKP